MASKKVKSGIIDNMNANFYREFFNPGDLVYDVGAHRGAWIDALLKNGAGRVVAIEPQYHLSKFIADRFANMPVTVLDVALGDSTGTATMQICCADSLATLNKEWTSACFPQYRWKKAGLVNVTTLDEVIFRHGKPSFIKMDVEGYESQVLSGLSVPVYSFCLEYNMKVVEYTYKCIDLLGNLGDYEYSYNLGDYQEFKHEWDSIGKIMAAINRLRRDDLWGSLYARLKDGSK
jgi:FkbM family methyltransferase